MTNAERHRDEALKLLEETGRLYHSAVGANAPTYKGFKECDAGPCLRINKFLVRVRSEMKEGDR